MLLFVLAQAVFLARHVEEKTRARGETLSAAASRTKCGGSSRGWAPARLELIDESAAARRHAARRPRPNTPGD